MCLAMPGQILEIREDETGFPQANVSFSGVMREVALMCTPDAQVGDYVLVHAGIAINKINTEEAHAMLDLIANIPPGAL